MSLTGAPLNHCITAAATKQPSKRIMNSELAVCSTSWHGEQKSPRRMSRSRSVSCRVINEGGHCLSSTKYEIRIPRGVMFCDGEIYGRAALLQSYITCSQRS